MNATCEPATAEGHEAPPVRVLIADDHQLVRNGIKQMLDLIPNIELVGEASNGNEAVALCKGLRPNLVLMDVRMPDMDGLTATKIITDNMDRVNVVMLTSHDSPDYIIEALRFGASGYLLKESTIEEIEGAIEAISNGETPIAQDLAVKTLSRLAKNRGKQEEQQEKARITVFHGFAGSASGNPLEELTGPEREALILAARGHTNPQIAKEMFVAVSTVKGYFERILLKLGSPNRTQAAVKAIELGILDKKAA